MRNFRKRAEQEAASSSQERSWEVIRFDGKGASGVFHGILYHLVSPCQGIFCSVLGIGEGSSASSEEKNAIVSNLSAN